MRCKEIDDLKKQGYMSSQQLLLYFGKENLTGQGRINIINKWPEHSLIVSNVRLWSPSKVNQIIKESGGGSILKLNPMALNFIKGHYLPKGYKFRKPNNKAFL
ncbi:MAG: hypothetical protein WC901_00950 [Candidatus Margulisiibacteriota bacterium]